MTEPALMTAKEAAKYLGVSKSFFEEKIRPYIAAIDMRGPGRERPMPRWEKAVLDAHIASRRKAGRAA